ncbi:Acg family FMN-binding oxidoreductase [Thermasporomyces composti]|uniref:Nitroreductase family protein n=1 Tax=Thermasporomyces composti TaxID=696763 RepID=A0A3D9VBM2_THECX|nr:nitroreductase family protein [Thermasporomyces composti]REF38113.1 nitroreductase family protein [Thermasporomyces composti]
MLDHELEAMEREILLEAAVLAPSMHNTQPWKFAFRDDTIEVHRDPLRQLGAEDPEGRMLCISVGAVVFNIRVAAASLGRATRTSVLPDPARPLLVAEVRVGEVGRELPDPAGLYPYLPRRRTSRQPFDEREIPSDVRSELAEAAAREGAVVEWVTEPARVRRLLGLAVDAEIAEADDPRRLVERMQWVGGDRERDGIPSDALGPRPAEGVGPVRDLAVEPSDRLRATAAFERHPQLVVVWTPDDDPPAWLAAGQAMQRVLLLATSRGLAASPLTQPLEHAELREAVRQDAERHGHPQLILRLGYGPPGPRTPRRAVEEFLLDDTAPGMGGD